MSWRVILRPKAEADLREAARWYESQRPMLGSRFLDQINRTITLLQDSLERHSVYYRGFRRMPAHRFPYKLFYRIEGNDIIVFRVLHAKRDHRLHL